jgi:serine/threonine protein kinase
MNVRGIVHRDLKLENIMICKEVRAGLYEPKIIDFGLSGLIGPNQYLGIITNS